MVSHDDQRWHVHLAPHGSVADQFAAGAVIGVALTVSLVGVNRLGVCAIASCPRVFLDASPGKSRRYCTEHAAAKGNVSTLRRQPDAMPERRPRENPRTPCRREHGQQQAKAPCYFFFTPSRGSLGPAVTNASQPHGADLQLCAGDAPGTLSEQRRFSDARYRNDAK